MGDSVVVVNFEEKEIDLERTQRELRRADKTIDDFKTALDEHAIVAITDSQGTITYVNEKFCMISQYSEAELLGQNHRILNSGHHPKCFFQSLWEVIRSGGIWRGEIKNRRKDGTFYWVKTTIVPFLDNEGKPEQYIAIRADITEEKLMEERLRVMTMELGQKNQELESVLHAASHDLRSPLINVQGFASVIGEQVEELRKAANPGEGISPSREALEKAGQEIGRSLEFIEAGVAKMDALLNGLLAISRVGLAQVDLTNTDVGQLVRNNLTAMNYQIEQAGAKVIVGELPPAQADDHLLGQVFANLIGNALKFASPDRPIKLEVSGGREGSEVTYSVKDNGIGISESQMAKIFDLFHRLQPSETEGQGMGLAIVRRALDRMGGRVSVNSQKGVGSVFKITIRSGGEKILLERNRSDHEDEERFNG